MYVYVELWAGLGWWAKAKKKYNSVSAASEWPCVHIQKIHTIYDQLYIGI